MSLALSEGGGVEGRGVVGVEGVGVETEGEAGVELVVLMGVEGEGDVTDDEGVGEATDDEGTGDATDWGDDTWYFHQKLFNKIIIYIFIKGYRNGRFNRSCMFGSSFFVHFGQGVGDK